jgi:uncharacterized protein
MARIALIGASGNIGSRVLAEALARGHTVIGIVRHPQKLTPQANFQIVPGDIANPGELAEPLRGADVVVASVRWTDNAQQLLEAVRKSGVTRLLAVVGAGSLLASPGVRVLDTPEFPAAWRPGAEAAARALDTLRTESAIDWVAVVEYRARATQREIPGRRRSAAARCRRREPHFARGLRGGAHR